MIDKENINIEHSVEEHRILEECIKVEAKVGLEISDMEDVLAAIMRKQFNETLNRYIKNEVQKCIEGAYGSKHTFKDALQDVISQKLDEKYPGIVDDKVDELAEKIKNFKFEWTRREEPKKIRDKAMDTVNSYIENELSKSVAKSTEYVEQFSRNYFANNLFRAMGMMGKMIPFADAANQDGPPVMPE